ncbi:hypothetical protein O3M35_006550 [Rhynocoris fuscipes]|uniref:Alpha 1,4-glycosyltransferase domain-containing protein n=1 Tax=Rhynocoris fuscipes TaxID=488301 RepID=A0AAW1DJ64_9HEMI
MFRIKKIYFLITFVLCCLLIAYLHEIEVDFIWIFWPSVTAESIQIACYENNSINTLQSMQYENVPKNTSFFFVETSCHDKFLQLNPRQSCAIESVGLLNPSATVYLLIPSPIKDSSKFSPHTKVLLSYNNIKFRHVDMSKFFISTPLEKWYEEGKLKSSKWPRSHASDILRYTALWKYGGTYVDLDIVLLKSLEGILNYSGQESPKNVAAGLMSFSHGHPLADIAIKELRDRFKGYLWGYNGPLVITRSLKKFCGVSEVSEMTKERCHGFTVYPPKAIYPIHWKDWKDYFTTDKEEADKIMTKFNESLAIHLWNKFSYNEPVTIGSLQPYDRLAAKFCPRVYSTLGGVGHVF